MQVPQRGFGWLGGEESDGACGVVPKDKWVGLPANAPRLWVRADGPSGSGRYWTVTVGVAGNQPRSPGRGFCFSTWTVGWRTLQSFGQAPLRWIDDRDGDGKPELIVWDSMPLSEEPSLAEYALVAWVYQLQPSGKFVLDSGLTCRLWREIAAAYRKPLRPDDRWFQPYRDGAARTLEDFATGLCKAPERRAP